MPDIESTWYAGCVCVYVRVYACFLTLYFTEQLKKSDVSMQYKHVGELRSC